MAPIRGELPPFTSTRSVIALILREMGSTYGRSPGGYLWAVVQPIGMILILALGFSLLFKSPSLGTSFLLFYATGYLAYDLYNQLVKKVIASLTYSRAMLAYPRIIWIDAVFARFLLNTLTLLTVFCIVISGILIYNNSHTIITIQPILIGLSICAALGLGVGMMNCLLTGLFPVWKIIWGILTRPMMIASGVLFIYEDLPRLAQDILWWNPVIHATGLVRQGFYPTYHASYVSIPYCMFFSMGFIAAGLLFLRAYARKTLAR